MNRHRLSVLAVVMCFGPVAASCADGTGPTRESLVGAYEAVTLAVFEGTDVHDILALNGGAGFWLLEDGVTTGEMLIPPPVLGPAGARLSLDGHWVVQDSTISYVPSDVERLSSTMFQLRSDGSFAGAFEREAYRIAVRFVSQGNCRTRQC